MKKSFYVLKPLLIYIVVRDLVQFLLYYGAVGRLLRHETFMTDIVRNHVTYVTAGVQIASMLMGMIVLMLLEKYRPQKLHPASDIKRYCYHMMLSVAQTLLLAFSLNVIILNSGLEKVAGRFAKISESQSGIPVVMGIILFGFVSPVVEEYVFRGMLYTRLRENYPVSIAISISALFFGVYHGNIIQGVYGFMMGWFIADVYETHDRLKMPMPLFTVILCHALANLLIYFGGRYGLIADVPVYGGVLILLLAVASLTLRKKI